MAAKLEDLARHRKSRQDGSKRAPKSGTKLGSGRGCPICGAPPAERFRPFCSGRCADIDLGHWLTENYRLPVEEQQESESEKTEVD